MGNLIGSGTIARYLDLCLLSCQNKIKNISLHSHYWGIPASTWCILLVKQTVENWVSSKLLLYNILNCLRTRLVYLLKYISNSFVIMFSSSKSPFTEFHIKLWFNSVSCSNIAHNYSWQVVAHRFHVLQGIRKIILISLNWIKWNE